jgi:hypothetical protein
MLLPPILVSLADSDKRVRLAALEALFNISRVVRDDLAPFASQILAGLPTP